MNNPRLQTKPESLLIHYLRLREWPALDLKLVMMRSFKFGMHREIIDLANGLKNLSLVYQT